MILSSSHLNAALQSNFRPSSANCQWTELHSMGYLPFSTLSTITCGSRLNTNYLIRTLIMLSLSVLTAIFQVNLG